MRGLTAASAVAMLVSGMDAPVSGQEAWVWHSTLAADGVLQVAGVHGAVPAVSATGREARVRGELVGGMMCFTAALSGMVAGCMPAGERVSGRPAAEGSAPSHPVAPAVPRVDHHQHVMSPAMARHWSEETMPAVELPAELQDFLTRRHQAFGNRPALAALYHEDAVFFDVNPDRRPIYRSRDAVLGFVAQLAQPYRITPVTYWVEGSAARISGYYTVDDAEGHPRHLGHVLLNLRRHADGPWQIDSETLVTPGPSLAPVSAARLITLLDQAGIQRSAVFSVAYGFASPRALVVDDHAAVRAENDWTAVQIAAYPDRLTAFCSFNPLSSYALEELERCAAHGAFRGIKLHFGNADVDLLDPEQLARVRDVFSAADRRGLAIAVHLSRYERPYTRDEQAVFVRDVLPTAPNVTIQIAHLTGWGGFSPAIDEALEPWVRAVEAGDPVVRNVWFDATSVVSSLTVPRDAAERIAERVRQLGVQRVVFGSDLATRATQQPRQAWAMFRGLLPLTDAEFGIIAGNSAPYMR